MGNLFNLLKFAEIAYEIVQNYLFGWCGVTSTSSVPEVSTCGKGKYVVTRKHNPFTENQWKKAWPIHTFSKIVLDVVSVTAYLCCRCLRRGSLEVHPWPCPTRTHPLLLLLSLGPSVGCRCRLRRSYRRRHSGPWVRSCTAVGSRFLLHMILLKFI